MKQITIDKEPTLPTLYQTAQLFLHRQENCNTGKTHLQDPLVLPKLWVKSAFLQRAQLEGEAGSKLLNANFLLILEDVP